MALFGKPDDNNEERIELDESVFKEEKSFNVAVKNLNDISDIEGIQQEVREGKLVFLRIREMREKDINELKRSVERLKKTINANDGDIVMVGAEMDPDLLIICPPSAAVFRG
ncbi:MAG: cell division protein SepF [Candidatus Aenigmarchaeota archaeon]|nr:cell division protein SepF [Candidatus Aenigmarchaeota archaeon]